MEELYNDELAYIHAVGFEDSALGAAPEIIRRLKTASIPIRRVVDVGCGGGSLTKASVAAAATNTGGRFANVI